MSELKIREHFPPVSTADWEAAIHRDLKGADYNKKLVWQSDEGIAVKPYYRSGDTAGLPVPDAAPGSFPYERGTHTANQWRVRETIAAGDPAAARRAAQDALAAGAEEIAFSAAGLSASGLAALVQDLDCPVHFSDTTPEVVAALGYHPDLEGSLDYDPLADGIAVDVTSVRKLRAALPRFRAITVRAHRFHDSGSTAVQECAFALAVGIEYLSALTEAGMSPADAAASLTFSFSVGSSFFFEIAKLRAFRGLWARAVESFGGGQAGKAVISSRTSRWNKTVYDPYVNVLRATTEAMSAAMGGCDSLSVTPFDATYREPSDAGKRLARNTQLILKKEAWLDRTVDPAGGSYYLEVLTDSLARASWKLMQQVEAAGGFSKAAKWIAGEVEKSRAAKAAAVASRRRTIVGTNQYPNAAERMAGEIQREVHPRAAEGFEALRLATERSGRTPLFLLLETGDLKMRKARAGFAANLFGCAGFQTRSVVVQDAAAAVAAIAKEKPDAAVLCSSDEEYGALAPAVCAGAGKVPVIVAGYPKDAVEALTTAGVADFIHVRSNALETLAKWQQKVGVKG